MQLSINFRPLGQPQTAFFDLLSVLECLLGFLDERGTTVVGFNDEEMFVFWAFSSRRYDFPIDFRVLSAFFSSGTASRASRGS